MKRGCGFRTPKGICIVEFRAPVRLASSSRGSALPSSDLPRRACQHGPRKAHIPTTTLRGPLVYFPAGCHLATPRRCQEELHLRFAAHLSKSVVLLNGPACVRPLRYAKLEPFDGCPDRYSRILDAPPRPRWLNHPAPGTDGKMTACRRSRVKQGRFASSHHWHRFSLRGCASRSAFDNHGTLADKCAKGKREFRCDQAARFMIGRR